MYVPNAPCLDRIATHRARLHPIVDRSRARFIAAMAHLWADESKQLIVPPMQQTERTGMGAPTNIVLPWRGEGTMGGVCSVAHKWALAAINRALLRVMVGKKGTGACMCPA